MVLSLGVGRSSYFGCITFLFREVCQDSLSCEGCSVSGLFVFVKFAELALSLRVCRLRDVVLFGLVFYFVFQYQQ